MLLRLSPLPTGSNATPWREVPPFDELVGSWCAVERGHAEVAVQVRSGAGESGWYVLGCRSGDGWESVPGQADADGEVDVDVVRLRAPADAFRLRVTGAAVGALAACISAPGGDGPSAPAGRALEIEVPPLSQLVWTDVRPELDGGGRAWCSPTSLAMVLGRWGLEVEVPTVAGAVYDPASGGCGNWSCNVAFAASLGLDAVVTRLPSLAAARPLLEAGVPLVVSIVAGPGALPGFPLEAGTGGHLVVLAGETAEGDSIVYDPAATGAATVRRVYPRCALESAWLGGSRGTAYVVRPPSHPVPDSPYW